MKQAEEFITKLAQFEDYPSVIFNEVSYSYTNLTEKIAAFREEFISKGIVSGEVVLVKGDYSFESRLFWLRGVKCDDRNILHHCSLWIFILIFCWIYRMLPFLLVNK